MIPSEKIAQFSSAPPLKRLNSAATLPPDRSVNELRNQSCSTAWLTPGVVIAALSRTMTMIANVKRIRRRSSGILTVFRNAEIISQTRRLLRDGLLLRLRRSFPNRSPGNRFCVPFRRRLFLGGLFPAISQRSSWFWHGNAAAGFLNLFPSRRAYLLHLNA